MKRHQWNRRMTVGSAGSGFTLVELLVVILILSALLLIALPKYFHAVYASRVQGCKAQITIINTATQVFFAKNKVYPATRRGDVLPDGPGLGQVPASRRGPAVPLRHSIHTHTDPAGRHDRRQSHSGQPPGRRCSGPPGALRGPMEDRAEAPRMTAIIELPMPQAHLPFRQHDDVLVTR